MDTMQRFLQKLRELLRAKVKDAELSEEDFNSAVRQARSHVGGMVRWERTREEREAAATREGHTMNTFRLLGEMALSEDGKSGRVQIFPAVGTYSHPRYGELAITPGFLQAVKANFDAKAYQQELPLTIDLEHESKLSGAAGWIRDVEIDGDKGMWATVEFNDRGRKLVGEDAYRYFSPEFYDKWQDPATSTAFENVLIGGALTNRPFFKGMAPVAMMAGEGIFAFAEMAEDDSMPDMDAIMAQMQAMMRMMQGMMGKGMDKNKMAELGEMMTKLKKQMPKMEPDDRAMAEGETKTEDGASYPKEAFLYTPDDMPSHWKMRIWQSPEQKVTRAQLGAAAAALGKGFRGQAVQLPPGEKEKAITKLRGLYQQMGVKPDEMPAHVRASLAETDLTEAEIETACVALLGHDDDTTGGSDVGMSEDEARQFAETQTAIKALREELAEHKSLREKAESDARQAKERVDALERDARRKTLAEHVESCRSAYPGEVSQAVDKLEKLATQLSSEDFAEYLGERETWHKRLKESALFSEIGRPVTAPNGAMGEFDAAVAKAMSETPGLSKPDAIAKVATEQPALYGRYDKAFKHAITRGEV